MIEDQIEDEVRQTLAEAAAATAAPEGLLERLVANSRNGERRIVPLRRRGAWLYPLLAAAAVVAVGLGAGTIVTLSADHDHRPALNSATPRPDPSPTATATHRQTAPVAPPPTSAVPTITKATGAATQPVTTTDLMSAPVPALRGNPAGVLQDGVLRGPHGGQTQLELNGGAAPAHGDFTGDGVQDAAAVLGSTSGAGGEDQYVELYTNRDRLLGGFDPARVDPNGHHAYVMAMVVRGGAVLLDWTTDHGGSSTAVSYWSAELTWNGHSVVVSGLEPHTGITGSQLWSDQHLTITPTSLGGVRLGMTLDQAQDAAGVRFTGAGDGYTYPTDLPDGYPHDYVGGAPGEYPVQCVGVDGNSRAAQTVSTPQGVALGDPAAKITRVYGAQAKFVPEPTGGGLDPRPGYVVDTPQGRLVFALDSPGGTVIRIAAGGPHLEPSGCTG